MLCFSDDTNTQSIFASAPSPVQRTNIVIKYMSHGIFSCVVAAQALEKGGYRSIDMWHNGQTFDDRVIVHA